MNRRHHHNIQPYDYDERFSARKSRDHHQAKGIEYQDDSLSSVNSDEESYLQHSHSEKDKKDCYFSKISQSKSSKDKSTSSNDHFHSQNDTKAPTNTSTSHQSNNDNNATNERLNRLENLLETLLKHNTQTAILQNQQQKQSPQDAPKFAQESNDGRFLLEPRRHDFTTSMWINKIQEIAVQNNYNELNTIKFMESQMSGIIKAWYKSLPNRDFSWPEWKLLITKTFPDNLDFITSLKRLVTRLKQADESIINYYFSKMYLIEACKITGEDAVSCLIDGLNNQSIQEQAKLQNYLTPETLFSQFLTNLPDYTVDYLPISAPVSENMNWYHPGPEAEVAENNIMDSAPLPHEFHYEPEERIEDINFNTHDPTFEAPNNSREIQFEPPPKRSGPVHSRLDKRFIKSSRQKVPLAAKVCTICHSRGHLARQCRRSNTVMAIEVAGTKSDESYFKKCYINGRKIEGFIDTGCNGVLLREEEARNFDINIRPTEDVVRGYGGKRIQVIGEADVQLEVDNVSAWIRVIVMPNNIQDIPVIIGQSFLNQKGVNLHVKNENVTVFKAPINSH